MTRLSFPLRALLCVLGAPLVFLLAYGAVFQRLLRSKFARPGDVLFVYSQVIWDDVWQRPQEHAWRTSANRAVVYCAPVQLHNWFFNLGRRYKQLQTFERGAGSLVVVSPLVLSGHFKWQLVHRFNSALIAMQVRYWLARAEGIYALANTPFALKVLKHVFGGGKAAKRRRLVYDVIDDFTAFDWSPAFGKPYDRELLAMADAVLTGTHQLAKSRHGSTFIPCGVNFTEFSTPAPPPEDIATLPKPLIGYFGTISERIDLDLIASICDSFPQASVVLIGPVHFQTAQLPQRPNLHYLGLKPHGQIPAYAKAFDVGLIPFRITPATIQLHPVKTLEYLAAGVPVVSTALPEIEHFYSDTIDIARTPDQFLAAIRKNLEQPDGARIAAGIERARNASWEAMTDRINAMLFASDQPAATTITDTVTQPSPAAAPSA